MASTDSIKHNYIHVSSIEKIVVNLKKRIKTDIWYAITFILRQSSF